MTAQQNAEYGGCEPDGRTDGKKPCSGDWQSYHRHRRRGERPCSPSLAAHRKKTAESRLKTAKGGTKT